MKILLLGTSSDAKTWFDNGKKRHEIAAERLTEYFGQPVEIVVKMSWPTDKFPRLVEKWIEETQPDVIHMSMAAFWFQFRSVPLRMQRTLGRFGPSVGTAGFKMADSKRWGHNRAFRAVRQGLQRTVGGDTHFTTDEVIERMSEVVRIACRSEGAVVFLKGAHGRTKYSFTKRDARRDERKRVKVDLAMRKLCEQMHISYDGRTEFSYDQAEFKGNTVGDGLHGNAERHVREAGAMFEQLRECLESAGFEPAAKISSDAEARPV